jgi:hypothetical protein
MSTLTSIYEHLQNAHIFYAGSKELQYLNIFFSIGAHSGFIRETFILLCRQAEGKIVFFCRYLPIKQKRSLKRNLFSLPDLH